MTLAEGHRVTSASVTGPAEDPGLVTLKNRHMTTMSAAGRRILKEYADLVGAPDQTPLPYRASFMGPDNISTDERLVSTWEVRALGRTPYTYTRFASRPASAATISYKDLPFSSARTEPSTKEGQSLTPRTADSEGPMVHHASAYDWYLVAHDFPPLPSPIHPHGTRDPPSAYSLFE